MAGGVLVGSDFNLSTIISSTIRDITYPFNSFKKYYTEIDKIIRHSESRNESSLRKPFQGLLEQYACSKNLVLVAEVELTTKGGVCLSERKSPTRKAKSAA